MNVLFIHQNFPGQFKHLSIELANQGHNVVALHMNTSCELKEWNGVKLFAYSPLRGSAADSHFLAKDFETKVLRAEGCLNAAQKLSSDGFKPDVIVAHPGWGESMFVKHVWPKAKLGIYCEFYYLLTGTDFDFDPEFSYPEITESCNVQLKNFTNWVHFEIADLGLSPTRWQANTYPHPFREKISVIHEGIDTNFLIPNDEVIITLEDGIRLSKSDEIITFVNRNLEPCRGFHTFMRSLPKLLDLRSNAHVFIVGGDEISYGRKPINDISWRAKYLKEISNELTGNMRSRIHFVGKLPYKTYVQLLQISTVHVYLTYPFVLSWSLLESMSLGCSIIASDTQPLHEVITNRKTGILVDFFDSKSLALEINNLINNSSLRKELSCNARSFAVENFDLNTICLPRQLEWIDQLQSI